MNGTPTPTIADTCPAMAAFAPDDPQGEDGTMPATNETCPAFPDVIISIEDDQGQDGEQNNGTCPMLNSTIPHFDDDQGSDESLNKTCNPLNDTMIWELADGFLDNATAPACGLPPLAANLTLDQDLGQGEDGALNQNDTCPLNSTIRVDDEQCEDGKRPHDSC